MKVSNLLGLNSRGVLYTSRYNSRQAKKIADSKLATNAVLKKYKVLRPKIYKRFNNPQDVFDYNWSLLPGSFALKPSRGLGGEGIIVVKKKAKSGWITTQKIKVSEEDLKLHTLDILEGAYSMGNEADRAFVQEYIGKHKRFNRLAFRGTPDIRIIVFNKIPVMAMLRLPTRESGGRANLHQGALGLGIDIGSGITTNAIWHNNTIKRHPDFDTKLEGIKLPFWNKILEIAVKAQLASGLGYAGVDVVLHPDSGPMIIELNAQPGLSIQLANMEGLKKRLERVDEMEVVDEQHGVRIAKALFGGRYKGKIKDSSDEIKLIKAVEEIKIRDIEGKKLKVLAKIDTGAWSSAIDIKYAKKLGLLKKNKILWYKKKMSSLGQEKRAVIPVTIFLANRKIKTNMTVADRKLLRYDILIGRVDLQGFLISPEIEKGKLKKAKWI